MQSYGRLCWQTEQRPFCHILFAAMLSYRPPRTPVSLQRHQGQLPRRSLASRGEQFRAAALLDSALLADPSQTLFYAGLSLSALAFVGTFFVAPRFQSEFKEELPWETIHGRLVALGVESLPPAEALRRTAASPLFFIKPAKLLDIRLPSASDAEGLPGALRAPLYKLIERFDVFSLIRKAAFAFFAVDGTERNPEWLPDLAKSVDKSQELIVFCERGGKLVGGSGDKFGFSSRSLKAVYLLREAGFTNVKHLEGGVYAWKRAGLPTVSAQDDE